MGLSLCSDFCTLYLVCGTRCCLRPLQLDRNNRSQNQAKQQKVRFFNDGSLFLAAGAANIWNFKELITASKFLHVPPMSTRAAADVTRTVVNTLFTPGGSPLISFILTAQGILPRAAISVALGAHRGFHGFQSDWRSMACRG